MKPRDHHYFFAHSYFRQLAFDYTKFVFFVLHGKTGKNFLLNWWYQVPQKYNSCKQDMEILLPKGLSYSIYEFGEDEILLLEMPKPEHTTEAYFIALYHSAEKGTRYFTLEHSEFKFGSKEETQLPRTVFCEWTESKHLNYGRSVEPEKNSFIKLVKEMLNSTKEKRAG